MKTQLKKEVNVNKIDVQIQLCHPSAKLPVHGSEDAIGYDLCCVGGLENLGDTTIWPVSQLHAWEVFGRRGTITLRPGEGFLFRTGIKQSIPRDYGCFLYDRSGMGAKKMVGRLAGVIDPDYRGEIFVRLVNHSEIPVDIAVGDKIVQAVYHPRTEAAFSAVSQLDSTARGVAGFGSTDAKPQE